MEKILVLRGGALGDFIVTLPALALLRERWPHARIELAGNATAAQLAANRGLLDAVHSQHEARWAALFGAAALPTEFGAWLASFDLVISYWPDSGGELAARFPMHRNQRFLSAAALPARAPAAAHYCEPLGEFGLQSQSNFFPLKPIGQMPGGNTAPSPRLDRQPRRGRRGSSLQNSEAQPATILIHPGSGSPRKNWPAEKWLALIAGLPVPVSLILGEAELPTWGALSTSRLEELPLVGMPRPGDPAVPALHPNQRPGDPAFAQGYGRHGKPPHLVSRPLEELVSHFAECRLYVGHDSGVSHLAAACGAKCVLLFGPTEPEMWSPPAPDVRVLRCDSDLAALPVDAVRSAVAEALGDQT